MAGLALGLDRSRDGPLGVLARTAAALAAAGAMAAPAVAAAPALRFADRSPVRAASGGGRPQATAVGGATINVYAAPGMDERKLARLVAQELDRRDRRAQARQRSAYQDRGV